MSLSSPRLSASELVYRILDMAQTGVYRASLLETFRPVATQQQIRTAIAQAKQFGLRSVADLRDPELGTYYEVDAAQYEAFQSALKAGALSLEGGEIPAQQLVAMTRTLKGMLAIAGGSALSLFVLGGWLLVTGQVQPGRHSWYGAAIVGVLWLGQRYLARRVL